MMPGRRRHKDILRRRSKARESHINGAHDMSLFPISGLDMGFPPC